MPMVRTYLAERVVAALRVNEAGLRASCLRHLSLFGSVARGDDADESDIDISVELDPAVPVDLVDIVRFERELAKLLGRPVHLTTVPIHKPRLRAHVDRDGINAF